MWWLNFFNPLSWFNQNKDVEPEETLSLDDNDITDMEEETEGAE